jgi:hypothetical protein
MALLYGRARVMPEVKSSHSAHIFASPHYNEEEKKAFLHRRRYNMVLSEQPPDCQSLADFVRTELQEFYRTFRFSRDHQRITQAAERLRLALSRVERVVAHPTQLVVFTKFVVLRYEAALVRLSTSSATPNPTVIFFSTDTCIR